MRGCNKNLTIAVLAYALAAPPSILSAVAADIRVGLKIPATSVAHPPQDPVARQIEARDQRANGITVGEPKVYDDALLQQMLQQAEARLAALQLIDQTQIAKNVGLVTGASQRYSSFGLNVQGIPLPQVVTSSKGPTGTSTEVEGTNAAGAATSTLTTVSGLGTQDVITTRAPFGPPTATAPTPSTTLPSAFSVSASDILNEQMQLTAEVNSLRLLLAGSLSDHFIQAGPTLGNSMTKLKTTLGFPITVIPDKRYKDAIAVVEVEVESIQTLSTNSTPAIAALLPREKTYNVASITDNSTSIGGGIATQILGVSGSWLRGYRTYYLVQDQDTVALTFQPESTNRVGFMWQFRPVLGRRYVKSGLKQTFVQLAFPAPRDAKDGEIGKVIIRTYWRKYDSKRGLPKEPIAGSVRVQVINYDIPRFMLAVAPASFNHRDSLEDLGGGQMLVKLSGRFLPGTYVRIGSTLLTEGTRLKHEHQGIQFIAPISDLATKGVYLVAHDGTEVRLRFSELSCSGQNPLEITEPPQITTVDEAHSRIRVRVNHPEWGAGPPPLVFVIGPRVFGYSDAPLQQEVTNGVTYLLTTVPNSLLISNPELTVQTLFPPPGCSDREKIAGLQTLSQTERLIVLEQGKNSVKFLLYGNRLRDVQILSPVGVALQIIGAPPEDGDTLRLIELSEEQLKANKQLLVQRKNERPFLITIPTLPIVEAKKPDPPKARERVTIDANEAVIEGEGMKELEKVTFKKQSVPFEVAEDGKSVRLSSLKSLGVTSVATAQTVELVFKSGKATVKIEVITAKVETVPK